MKFLENPAAMKNQSIKIFTFDETWKKRRRKKEKHVGAGKGSKLCWTVPAGLEPVFGWGDR